MFTSSHVMSAHELRRDFVRIARRLRYEPQGLLIALKSNPYLVLLNADIFKLMARVYGEAYADRKKESPESAADVVR